MSGTRTARCSCGNLSVTVNAEPIRISVCHCRACQRRTGSPFGQQARFARAGAEFHGASRLYTRSGDSGRTITFHFCDRCGSTVYYELEALPEVIAIPVGGFADPAFPPPRVSVYDDCRHPWVALPDGCERTD
jgi:hypothetical protein